ncbi:MAG: sulfotransferase [Marinoscillum sp.]|uniref:sulfotransferase family protein n=1 Tax=Marinoscillum sp. TaxID=2024838 RepID=UPI0033009EDC
MNNWWKTNITSPVINRLGRIKELNHFSRAPILIGGCGRSGTSLLLSMLSAHPKIFSFPKELDAFTEWHEGSGGLVPTRLDRLYRAILTHRIPTQSHRWCEKRPANVRYISEILRYFGPDARFIHLVRDPRAVCTSIHPERPHEYWIPVDRYIGDVAAGLTFADHPQVFTLKYEHLITDYAAQMSRLCHFIEEPMTEEMHHWYEHARVRNNRAWFGSVKEVYPKALDQWKNQVHQARVEEIMKRPEIIRIMDSLGYVI